VALTTRLDPVAPPSAPERDDEVTRTLPREEPRRGTLEGGIAAPMGENPGAQAAKQRGPARRCPSCEKSFSGEARFCPFDGDALVDAPDWNPSADPLLGRIVDGRYEVLSVIGEGGMGTVYETRHTTLGRRFAMKVLRRDIADEEHVTRFIREAKAAAAIGHPNIVAVSDFGELASSPPDGAPPVPYFVMEYLTGISLAALLRAEKTLAPVRAAEIALQCAAGLAAAHAAGVIHRDLKPDNVFLTRSGDRELVKLLDFGVAKMSGTGRLTRAGMVFGTPHYMSPEQAAGQSVDHRADVYALGIILYEALAGRVPFEADTYMGVLTKHMFATPEPIDRVAPDASKLGALGPLTMRCLAKSPQDRFASMAEVVAAIELALADGGLVRPGTLRSERPRGRSSGGVSGPVATPGLRPVVGPVGFGLGGLLLVAMAVIGTREIRGAHADVVGTATAVPQPAASAAPTALEAPPASGSTAAPTAPVAVPPLATATSATPATASATPVGVAPAGTHTTPSRPPGGRGGGKKLGRGGGDVVDPWNK
jgi:hypothetical protein